MTKPTSTDLELKEKYKRFCRTDEAADNLVRLIQQEVTKALTGLKVEVINTPKFTTDHWEGYKMACEDHNREIDRRIAELTKGESDD